MKMLPNDKKWYEWISEKYPKNTTRSKTNLFALSDHFLLTDLNKKSAHNYG